jgi:hypothetical protein
MAALDQLWGAVLDELNVDLASQGIVLTARVTTDSDVVVHRLELRDVSDFRFQSSIPGPWDYAEITEAHLAPSPTGGLSIELVLWSEAAGISISAGAAILNGSAVVLTT